MPDETRAIEPTPDEKDPLFTEPDLPYAYIQWKGTDVCMDVYCECGASGHVHGMFRYQLKCRNCGKVWRTGIHVKLYPPTEDDPEIDPEPFGET